MATVAVQLHANTEYRAIEHDGVAYVEYPSPLMGVVSSNSSAPDVSVTPATATKSAPKVAEKLPTTNYTEDELMGMDVKELEKLCIKYNIDMPAASKKTNKYFRTLILEWQEEGGTQSASAVEDIVPTDDAHGKVLAVLIGLDSTTIKEPKAIKQLCDILPDADEDEIADLVDTFMGQTDISPKDFVSEFFKDAPVVTSKGKSPSTSEKASKTKLVSEEDLEVGNKVSVYWENNEEWYSGEVVKISRKGTDILYEDGETVTLDESHTEIKLIS